jgi:predicted kinase
VLANAARARTDHHHCIAALARSAARDAASPEPAAEDAKHGRVRKELRMEGSSAGPRLIIVCGLPGSGKTTRAKALETRLRAVRFSPDEWLEALALNLTDEERRGRIEVLQWKLARELLALGLVVIIEWGTWGRSERDALRLGARALGAAVELHYLDAPLDLLFERIQRRGMEHPPIAREALSQWREVFQAPTSEEIALFDEPLVTDFAATSD